MAILAAVDGDQRPDRAVSVANDLAAAFGDALVVVHVMPESRFEAIRDEFRETQTSRSIEYAELVTIAPPERRESENYFKDDASEDAARVAEEVVEATLDASDGVAIEGRVGKPVEELLDLAADLDARYVVVGGRKRSPAGKALFGSVTQSLLLSADRPVVAVMRED